MFRAHEVPGNESNKHAAPRPDAAWQLLQDCPVASESSKDADRCAAGCSLWWKQTPVYPDHRLGLIGHYFAKAPEAGTELLRVACRELAAHGCTLAVGPMDGSTWNRYRFITERGTEPLFCLEPGNPDDYPGHFIGIGFAALSHYYSAVTDDLATEDPRLPDIAAKLESDGVQIRNLRPDQYQAELRAIYSLSCESFRDNFLYTPLSEADFLEQYRDLQPVVFPPLMFLAEKQGALIAYLFCIPDYRQKKHSGYLDTVVVKTMATHPDYRGSGLGSLLMARCHATARRLGYRRVIHALMHEGNLSRRISTHTARVFRRYTLFARLLDQLP